jgi:peptidoglycan/LPS O-acetylase OafA/YrhL
MTEPPGRRGYRADLQGLRTVAVLLVVVYHLSPGRLPGGFVGVDVFFVLSGFLITRMLAGELDATGTIRFGRFLQGRMRRLFPAAAVVLAASLIATVVVLPSTRWLDTAWHVLASALQVENWALALETTDYLHPQTGPVITQHFWSLSVEWQVYAIWIGLFALALLARRRGRPRFALVAMVLVTALSFATSIVMGALDPAAGYFLTPTRVWEFGAGAIVASVARRLASRVGREVAGWAGLSAILVIAVVIPPVPFPGWIAAIPVLATAAILFVGDPVRPTSLERVLGLRPMVLGGDLSYAIYLWHWPVLLVFLAVAGLGSPGVLGSLLVVGLTVALAALTTRFAEQPIRHGVVNRRVVLGLIAAGTAPLLLAGLMFAYVAQARQQLTEGGVDARHPGALALDPGLAGFVDPAPLLPDPSVAFDDLGPIGPDNHCMLSRDVPIVCEFGDPDADRTLVVAGDSHGWQWMALFDEFGQRAGWRVESLVRPSCPFAETGVDVPGVGDDGTCGAWRTAVMARLLETPPDLVVTAGLTPFGYEFSDYHVDSPAEFADAYVAAWDRLAQAGIDVVALRDGPYFNGDMLECVAEHRGDEQACWAPRVEAFHEDPLVEASSRAGVPLLDLSDGICGPVRCDAVVGNIVVYRDRQHLTATYTLTMLPLLSSGLREAGVAVEP